MRFHEGFIVYGYGPTVPWGLIFRRVN
jgi:hypothetical protein